MKIKILSRVVIYDQSQKKILLAKNKGTDFWYAPGGGWEFEHENIKECAIREVKEETGLDVEIEKLLYAQEFHATENTIFIEFFWLGSPLPDQTLNSDHTDLDPNGQVEIVKWYTKEELADLKIFPKRLKNSFWDNIDSYINTEDPFIGVS